MPNRCFRTLLVGALALPGLLAGPSRLSAQGMSSMPLEGMSDSLEVCDSEVIVVAPGQDVQFTADSPLTGVWSSAFGSVVDGHYLAPATVPADGLDTVDFVGNDGSFVSFVVRLQPPGVVPMPADALVWQTGEAAPEGTPAASQASAGKTAMSGASPFAAEDSFVAIAGLADLPAEVVGGVTVYRVPALATISTVPALTLYARSPKPVQRARKCGVLPVPPWKGEACTGNGERSVTGPMQTTSYSGHQNVGTLTINASLRATVLRLVGIDIGGSGSVQVSREVRRYRQWYNTDFYRCVNGAWTFAYTRQCSRTGTEYFSYTPSWASAIFGTGAWSSWSCRNV
jgi:hypothetical protein